MNNYDEIMDEVFEGASDLFGGYMPITEDIVSPNPDEIDFSAIAEIQTDSLMIEMHREELEDIRGFFNNLQEELRQGGQIGEDVNIVPDDNELIEILFNSFEMEDDIE